MALVKCRKCGEEISEKATQCTKCGVSRKSIINKSIGYFILIGIIVIASIVISLLSKSKPTGKQQQNEKINDVIGIRRCIENGVDISTGAGVNYPKDETGQLNKGDKLFVLEENEQWIKFRVTPEDVGWHGWVSSEDSCARRRGVIQSRPYIVR